MEEKKSLKELATVQGLETTVLPMEIDIVLPQLLDFVKIRLRTPDHTFFTCYLSVY